MKKLIQRQMYKKIESIKGFREKVSGVPSWIRYMRKALNMTSGQLAKRMELTLSSLYQLERQEASDKINLQSLKKAAKAMDCDFVYAFIPRKPLSRIINDQAERKARKLVMSSHLHMEYEDQAVSKKELEGQVRELVETLKDSKNLWE